MSTGKPFPSRCPGCTEVSGWPVRARTEERVVVIDFRCRDCDHTWVESLPTIAARMAPRNRWPSVERRRTPRIRASA